MHHYMLSGVTAMLSGVGFGALFTGAARVIFPLLSLVILIRCGVSLLYWRREPELWGYLTLPNGTQLPISHWENLIGRAAGSDIQLGYPTISRKHAVLSRDDSGSWTIFDLSSKTGVAVNDERIEGSSPVSFGDIISLGGVEMTLVPRPDSELLEDAKKRTRPGREIGPTLTLFLLTLFQLLAMMQLCISEAPDVDFNVVFVFLALIGVEWAYYIVMRLLRRTGFEVETIAFYLTTLGMAVVASSAPGEIKKQFLCVIMGLFAFVALGWFLRDLSRAKKVRYIVAGLGIALFAFNLVFGREVNGAKNWIYIGSLSFQPSELVKLAFIYVGASSLDRLMSRRNLILFIIYTGVCCGCLALMNDFGTAAIFFVAFVIIAFLRSGDVATIALICAGTGFAGVMAVRFKPYILSRFEAWRHAWEYASTSGYQQTRTMICAASGGIFGLGAGNGWLKYVAASDTDLVFGFVCEEWGLIIAVTMVLLIAVLAAFTVRSASVGRSSFYVIGACAAMSMLMIQTMLNVFGSVDILPLTGVTFPFVSNGGSSMISSWGLLAFVKAADTRQNASFAIRLQPKRSAARTSGGPERFGRAPIQPDCVDAQDAQPDMKDGEVGEQ